MRIWAACALLAGAMAVAGCGSGDNESESTETQATSTQALREIDAVRDGLATALASYRAGKRAAADRQVGDTYLKHFELVEDPLEDADHELNEKLEDAIREELRGEIKDGAPASDVAALVEEIRADLDRAEAALR